MDYYHSLVTEKSWLELTQLSKLINFTLIGGWATYLYTKTLKSKDIDIIILFEDLSVLKDTYSVYKNDRLHKYEAVRGEVQIDIYLPHFSRLGLPVEDAIGKTRVVEGFTLVDANYLFVMKLFTLRERGRTPKGRKDFLDLLALVLSNMLDYKTIQKLLTQYNHQESLTFFAQFLSESTTVTELNINTHNFSQLKKKLAVNLHLSCTSSDFYRTPRDGVEYT